MYEEICLQKIIFVEMNLERVVCDTPGMLMATLPELDILDPELLKALIVAQHDELRITQEQLRSCETEIEHLNPLAMRRVAMRNRD